MDLNNFYDYFDTFKKESIVDEIHNVDVFDIQKTMEAIKSRKSNDINLVVEDPSSTTNSANNSQFLDVFSSAIVILQKVSDKSSTATSRRKMMVDLYNRIEKIKISMISAKLSSNYLWKDLSANKIETHKVGPISDSLYGWRMNFEFKIPLNVE